MINFMNFYTNRELYKEYISSNIFYLLNLCKGQKLSCYDELGEDDPIAQLLATAAMDELKKQEIFNFYHIITDTRFNDKCCKKLFELFFEKNNSSKNKNEIIDTIFKELLEHSFFSFSYIFENDERENYCGYIQKNKQRLNTLIDYLSEHKLYYYSISNFLPESRKKELKSYLKKANNQKYIFEIMYAERGRASLCTKQYVGEYESKKHKEKCISIYEKIENLNTVLNKTKYEFFLQMISIGFGFPAKKAIGAKKNVKKTQHEIICYPDTPYYETLPLFFNNPVIEFKECLNSLDKVKNINLTKDEKNLIISSFNELYYETFEEE